MQCSDLDRYLEAYLDERLGRGRSAILRRHTSACSTCRDRLVELKQFELELNKKLRSMHRSPSIWAGLELDLVRSPATETPPVEQERSKTPTIKRVDPAKAQDLQRLVEQTRPKGKQVTLDKDWVHRTGMAMLGIALVVAAIGGVYQTFKPTGTAALMDTTAPAPVRDSGLIDRPDITRPTQTEASERPFTATGQPAPGNDNGSMMLSALKGSAPVHYPTSSPTMLRRWVLDQTGVAFPPFPVPDGYHLVGGSAYTGTAGTQAIAVYDKGGAQTLLLIKTTHSAIIKTGLESLPTAISIDDVPADLRWYRHGFTFSLLTETPPVDRSAFMAR